MEAQLKEFANQLAASAGVNLISVIVYGSFESEDFHHGFSDINVMCIFNELTADAIRAISTAIVAWTGKKHSAPLLLTSNELAQSADVFAIEFLDIQQKHRVLLGKDLIADLQIPMTLHRIQLEHELRTKLIRLRQRYLFALGDRDKVVELMIESLSSFLTLFRHALIALGERPPHQKRAVVQHIEQKLRFDGSALLELLAVREGAKKESALDVDVVFSKYLASVERVITTVNAL